MRHGLQGHSGRRRGGTEAARAIVLWGIGRRGGVTRGGSGAGVLTWDEFVAQHDLERGDDVLTLLVVYALVSVNIGGVNPRQSPDREIKRGEVRYHGVRGKEGSEVTILDGQVSDVIYEVGVGRLAVG